MGVVVRRYNYIDFLNITYPYSSCICSCLAAVALLFVHFLKSFSFLGEVQLCVLTL